MMTVIISPSGNLYGSEQVLIDYLLHTKNNYTIYAPKSSVLESELQKLNTYHTIRSFNSKRLQCFYFKLLVLSLFGLIKKVYWNESGHIRYAKMFANIFRNKSFYIHIRIIEDTKVERLGKIPNNLNLLTISDYMFDLLSTNYNVIKIYDPFIFDEKQLSGDLKNGKIRIGIVGRITKTKGLNYLNNFLLKLEDENNFDYEFHFFGHPNTDDEEVEKLNIIASRKLLRINFLGFVTDKKIIYQNIDILLHLSTQESLGRIIFEAISYNKPFIVSDQGGCAEIAKKLHLNDFIIKFDIAGKWANDLNLLIEKIKNNYSYYVAKVMISKNKALKIYSIEKYTSFIDKLLV